MYKIVFGAAQHETNTFSPYPTGIDNYRAAVLEGGEALFKRYTGVRNIMGSFIAELGSDPEFELVPAFSANAMPSGRLTREAYDYISENMLECVRANADADGVLLCLHGAMVAEGVEDGEGVLLKKIRDIVGEGVPIITTLDLHANVTKLMCENATALISYDEYPHTDAYARGVEAARLMRDTVKGLVKPVMRFEKLPLLMPLIPTANESFLPLLELVHSIEAEPKMLNVGLCHGFFCADIFDCGASVIAIADGDAALAESAVSRVAREVLERKETLTIDFISLEQAVELAKRKHETPLVLADFCDNPGAGSSEDGTHLIRALVASGAENALVVLIHDPESTERCFEAGEGARVELSIGGKHSPELLGAPYACEAEVVSLVKDGDLPDNSGCGKGVLKRTALVSIGGVSVILSAVANQPADFAALRRHKIDPRALNTVVVKSSVHFRAAYKKITDEIYAVDCGGLVATLPKKLHYEHLRPGVYVG